MAQQIDLLKNTSFEGKMDSLIEAILKGANYDYAQLMNKPSINGYTLEGNKTNAQLGIPTKTSDITNDSGFIEDKNYVHTDENFTSAEKTKLDSVENGAEANVQANWSETDSTEDSFIKNKPTIPSKTSELSNDSNFVVDADYKHTDNNYTTADKNSVATIGDKVDKVTGKELSTNDLTDTLKANYDDAYSKAHTHTNKAVLDATTASFTLDDQKKLTNIESGAQKNTVTGVKGSAEEDYRIGNVNITKTNVGLENVVNERQWSANNHPTTMSDYGITDGVSNTDYTTLKGRVDTNEDNIAMLDSDVEGLNTDVSTLKTDMTTVKGAVTTIQGDYVPKTRKVNGKALNTDITLSASDVRAIASTLKGAKNGVAELDANGLIPSSQLPSYVDDVLEYDTKTDFPTTGESGKIYIATNTNLQYRWTGTQYVEISSSLALGETSSTAYRGDRGKTAYDHSQKTSGNPHNVTKSDVGLENVVNERQWSANNHPTTMSDYGITDGVSNTDYTTLKGRVDTNEDNIAMLDSDVEGLNTDVSTLKTDMTTVKGAVTTIQGDYVPKTRKVNGKALNTDITLSASDVRAIASTLKGAKNGVAELDANGLIPSSQLPSYVDDVLEYDTKTDFPTTGESGKIYIATNTNLQYRWTGTQYVEISSSLALGETSSTAYRGDRGKTAYDHSQKTSGNPHNVTKSDVGLENVGNFKAVSTVASQGLTDTEKANARANIGAGTGNSNFSGAYADLSGKPTLGTAASKDVASTGNASTTQVVMGNDTRLSDSRKASDVYAWAKVKTKPSYTKSEVGLGNVPNVTTNNQTPTFTKAGTRDLPISGETLSTIFGKILKWFSDLKSVAFSGSYKDLSDTPNFLTGGSQTTTSTADGGNNVFTFTKADGTNATFTVKNGSKGSTGTDGTSAGFGTPTASIDANVGTPSVTVTASGSNTAKVFNFAFKNLKGSTGARGTRGSVINYGTAITGTSTTATAFSSSGLTSSLINDMYINTSTFYLYRCTVAGNAANAKWVYVGSIKGAKGDKGDNATTTATGTASTAGLTKLYTGIGTATDGTMTQAAIKSVLGGKANSSHDHNRITSKGKHDEIASGTTANAPTAGMADATAGAYVTQSYGDSSAPSRYGNILNVVGKGTGQLFMGWSGADNTTEHLYYRSHRDTSTGGWGKWNTIIDSSNIGSQSVASATKVNGHTVNSDVPSNAKFTDTTYNDATTSAHGLMTAAMVRKLNGIATNANNYSLPTASSSTLGGVKVGSGLKITNGVLNLVWQ